MQKVAEAWLASKGDRRPSTQYCAENHVSHIVPVLGDLRLDQVTVADVERFREERRKTLAPRTVNKLLATSSATCFGRPALRGKIHDAARLVSKR